MNTQILWLLIKRINSKLNLGLLLSLLLFASPVIAGYVPPRNQKPPSDYTKSGGARGCPEERIPLTILAPTSHLGHTISKHPTFAWFLYSPRGAELRFFEFDSSNKPKQIGNPIQLQASKGINKYSLPENQPELTTGKKYIWQVSISCPDGDLVQRTEFMVVEMPSVLTSKIAATVNGSQKANLYAEQGLWYDALGEALKLAPKGKLGELGSTLVQSLAQSEKQGETQQRIENLQAIANQTR